MNPFLFQVSIYIISFLAVWLGSGLVLDAVTKLAQRLKLPAFTVSFFILGLMTSLPEMSIGLTAISDGLPQIFVGNLIGGTVVIFLLVIPLLSLANKGLSSPRQLNQRLLVLILAVAFAPALLAGDRQVETWEGIVCIGLYFVLFLFFSQQQNVFERISQSLKTQKINGLFALSKIGLGVAIIFFASQQIVDSTLYFASAYNIAPFFVSLIVVALGTNIPEMSLIVRALLGRKYDIALADYFGSASANTLLFGVFSLLFPGTVVIPNHFLYRFLFVIVGLVVFYIFLRSKNRLSRQESMVLILLYVGFVVSEFIVIN